MGNQTSISSCFSHPLSSSTAAPTAKLLDSDQNLRRVKLPIKAAELMLEQPGHAVSSADELRSKRRVLALRADDDLLPGKLYLLLPLSRINCKLSDLEMATVADSSNKRIGRSTSSKVLPAVTEKSASETGDEGCDWSVNETVMVQSHSRQLWNPKLEPIIELSREYSFAH